MTGSLASRTCLYVAAGRALGARDPDAAVRNPDYLAERLLGPKERALVAEQACVQALAQDYAVASKNLEAMGSAMMMQVRTRFIEERMEEAIENGALQLVILGAGFDTRAYRFMELLRRLHVFEVDQPASQEHKRLRVREAGIEVPRNLTYVPVDFRSDGIGTALGAAGYDPGRRTFFIWEGVTMYLPEEAIEETLRWVGKQAAGSAIVFDFVYRAVIDFMRSMQTDHLPEAAQQAMERVRKLEAGEPWLFGIPAGTEREFLKKFGLTLRELLPIGGEESRKRYLTRSDGSFYVSLPAMPRSPTGAVSNSPYCLAEAWVNPSHNS